MPVLKSIKQYWDDVRAAKNTQTGHGEVSRFPYGVSSSGERKTLPDYFLLEFFPSSIEKACKALNP